MCDAHLLTADIPIVGMDAFKARQLLLESVHGAISEYNDLFCLIAPVDHSVRVERGKNTGSSSSSRNAGSGNSRATATATAPDPDSDDDDYSDAAPLTISDLTAAQRQQVQQLSGFLTSVKHYGEVLYRLYSRNGGADTNNAIDLETEVARLQEAFLKQKEHEAKLLKQICALQNFLVNELNRSEDAEVGIKKKELELVDMTADRNNYRKQCQQLRERQQGVGKGSVGVVVPVGAVPKVGTGTGPKAGAGTEIATFTRYREGSDVPDNISSTKPPAAPSSSSNLPLRAVRVPVHTSLPPPATLPGTTEHESPANLYLGKFVRKRFGADYFFGWVVSYHRPFFKVVYDDSDIEDMTLMEVQRDYWSDPVPSTRSEQCRRHAQYQGMLPATVVEQASSSSLSGTSGSAKNKVKVKAPSAAGAGTGTGARAGSAAGGGGGGGGGGAERAAAVSMGDGDGDGNHASSRKRPLVTSPGAAKTGGGGRDGGGRGEGGSRGTDRAPDHREQASSTVKKTRHEGGAASSSSSSSSNRNSSRNSSSSNRNSSSSSSSGAGAGAATQSSPYGDAKNNTSTSASVRASASVSVSGAGRGRHRRKNVVDDDDAMDSEGSGSGDSDFCVIVEKPVASKQQTRR